MKTVRDRASIFGQIHHHIIVLCRLEFGVHRSCDLGVRGQSSKFSFGVCATRFGVRGAFYLLWEYHLLIASHSKSCILPYVDIEHVAVAAAAF